MRFILDTHTLLWAALQPHSLSKKAADALLDQANEPIVSAVSAWEIATKVRLGKLPMAIELEKNFFDAMRRSGYTLLPITAENALRAGRLVGPHRDPFDRMIAAQALELDVDLVSSDRELDVFGVRRIW